MRIANKGFTVIELILSFIFVMFLAIGMFTLVNNYRNREIKEAARRELTAYKTTLTQDIYEDIVESKVQRIRYCQDASGANMEQCINIKFLDGQEKQLRLDTVSVNAEEEGTTFTYDTFAVIYDGVKYENPEPKFAKLVNDYLLVSSSSEDALEYGVIYKIKIRIEHQDMDEEFVIDIVTTGVE